ncbi:MAG TPA: haloacid dehalogenase-like hydrolase, partial [Burkholderiaceae bacterium]
MLAPEALGQAPPHCSPAAAPARADDPPLVVDLDGTLLRTDSLVESLFVLAKRRPASLLALPCALRRGRAAFKRWVAVRARPELETLPFDEPMMDLLRAEKRRGRRLVLATGADQLLAQAIADRLDLFDEVLASDGRRNLAGQVKAERLVAAYGARGFDYAG